jgi:hypothetical protein
MCFVYNTVPAEKNIVIIIMIPFGTWSEKLPSKCMCMWVFCRMEDDILLFSRKPDLYQEHENHDWSTAQDTSQKHMNESTMPNQKSICLQSVFLEHWQGWELPASLG